MNRRRFLASGMALALTALMIGCADRLPPGQSVATGATVLALGDSITFGTGATPDTSYPAELARITGWTVINAGVPGDTSAQALQRLPALLTEHAPRLVLVSIGGNDFLRRRPAAETRANIRQICEQARASGAQVLLIAVPELSLGAVVGRMLSDHDLYAELSEELKVPLHRNGWSTVLGDPALLADAIHANAEGYRRFAQGLAASARSFGMLA